MKAKFYRFVPIGDNKKAGVLYAPEGWPYPISRDGEEVKNWRNLVVELKYGMYKPFHMCTGGANMVDEDLKNLLQSFIGDTKDVEFLPVKAVSEEYGDKQYYILHFTKIFDVIDYEHTVYAEGTDVILKVRLDYNKAKGLSLFNTRPYISDIIVSDEVRRAIKRNHLNFALQFQPIYCVGEDGEYF